ncbi:phage major capsid protein [Sphingomonas montana]|uniref:phage major capsid protein n=1 Tax=Sphingomonas montana TaxID=1843236 RepID=UPI00096D1DC5|nr:phage major capsid protein [Sphingomonas montana]
MTDKTPSELALELKTAFDTKHDQVKAIAEKALAEAERGTPLSQTAKELADTAIIGMNEAKARLDDLEQKAARRGSDEEVIATPGEAYTNSDEFKALNGNITQGRSITVEMKAITSLSTNADGSAGALYRAERVAGMLTTPPTRQLRIRDLLAPGSTASSQVEYPQESGFTNSADMVPEGGLKPESSLKYTTKTASVRKIAHWMRASTEILADAPALRSMIDVRLRYGLAFKEDAQLLNGNGVGNNLLGINAVAVPYVLPTGATAPVQQLDKLRMAILQVALAEYPASGFVLNPIDAANMEVLKDAANGYLISNPTEAPGLRIWGLPAVETQSQATGRFTTGAWNMAAQIFDRMQAAVTVSSEDRDNFVMNLVTILAEERLALAIYRPEAFVYGAF